MRSRRALLYVPGDDWNKINKAITLGADSICMDMEDGVALNRKTAARETIAKALQELNFGKSEKLARINAIGSGLELEDIETVLSCHPDGIVIPKIESREQIDWAGSIIEKAELANGWHLNSIRIIVVVETGKGIINLKEIASHPRLDGLIFGAEDFAANIGATRSRAGWEVMYARSAVVTHAAAYDLQSIDMVFIDFRDSINLKIEAAQGAAMGFTGKQIVHPSQVHPVQDAFTPSDAAVAYALRVVDTFKTHQSEGAGAYELDGKMIDMPILKNAQKVLERARAAGKITLTEINNHSKNNQI